MHSTFLLHRAALLKVRVSLTLTHGGCGRHSRGWGFVKCRMGEGVSCSVVSNSLQPHEL